MMEIAFKKAEKRAQDILSNMSLKEKIDYIGGYNGFNIRGYAHHGIPEIKMSDGPVGCRTRGKATAFASTIALAASWNPELSHKMGEALARECRAIGVHILLAPGVNIHRLPQCGRNFEYMGEDPLLTSQLAVSYIKGLQAGGVMATVKHFAANNHEFDRCQTSSEVDERTLREIYYPAFKAAVQEGNVGSVMNGYNLLNGEYCSQNRKLLVDTLKSEWGFSGFVMSDWVSTHGTREVIEGGLDLEMPSGQYMSRQRIMPLLKSGEITKDQIDDKVLRILRTCIQMGFFDRPQMDVSITTDEPETKKTTLEIARQGCVLLKNKDLLPLNAEKIGNLVITGPNAHPHIVGGGGSSRTEPFRSTSVVEALNDIAGDKISIQHIPVTTSGMVKHFSKQTSFETAAPDGTRIPGLSASYHAGDHLESTPTMERIDEYLDFEWRNKGPCSQLDDRLFSVNWTGYITPVNTGTHQIAFDAEGGLRVWVDDEMVIDDWFRQMHVFTWRKPEGAFREAMVQLQAGKEHRIRVAFCRTGINSSIKASLLFVDWLAIEKAEAIIACMGFNDSIEGEGDDRPFELPQDQRQFMDKLVKTNPEVMLLANAGGAFDVSGWIDDIPAFLHQWYSGQSGGQAVAEIITGKTNPSGKLPISYGKSIRDYPGQDDYPGQGLKLKYGEGIFVGYRHFDSKNIEPLYPFGFGLSYSEFEYSNLRLSQNEEENEIVCSVDVTNKSKIDGTEVVQVYVSFPESETQRPAKELKGFARQEVKAGQTCTVNINIKIDKLRFFNEQINDWQLSEGKHIILVGSSSRDIKLEDNLIVHK